MSLKKTRNSATLFLLLVLTLVFNAFAVLAAIKVSPGKPGLQLKPRTLAVKPAQTEISTQASISHVVVKFTDQHGVRLRGGQLLSRSGYSVKEAQYILTPYLNDRFRRLFGSISEATLERDREVLQAASGQELADLNGYYRIEVSGPSEAETIINQLNALDVVEIAYFEPIPELAGDIDPPTPDFQPYQDYRETAPEGVDADYANTLAGGDGTGVKIIDIEGNWQFTHEDLDKAVGGLIGGSVINDPSWRNHGTAVIGEMIAGDNGYGVTGICPGADIGMVSIATRSTSDALYLAIDNLQAGDAILIELHAPGPHYNFESRDDQLGYVCMEYWQSIFDAIQYAWAKGITVVEAAGNGAENFDDAGIYGQVFDTTYRNSHAIVVGAGYHPASGNDRIKNGFSNYGERVNVQGYGRGVYTTGYGDLFAPNNDENQYYTAYFSGTSSASPIVTGAVACIQGYYEATYGTFLTSDMIRDVFVATGSPQQGDTSLHIGPRPDLAGAIAALAPPPSLYTDPMYLDTSLFETETAIVPVWLHNRSSTTTLDFTITSNDSMARVTVPDWLRVSPSSGSVNQSDSTQVDVTLDATLLEAGPGIHKGMLKIDWGVSGGLLDSLTFVPVFLDVPCNDTTYIAASSGDTGGPTYNWISAVDLGSKVPDFFYYNPFGGNPFDDGTTGPHHIGFDFWFYGTLYDTVYIAVNGALSFTDTSVNVNGYYSGLDIPGAPFSTFVAPFYADLIFDIPMYPSAGIYLYRSPTNDTLVIEWYQASNFNVFGSLCNFELVMTSDGNILCQYRDIESSGLHETALIGIQETGCFALSYFDAGDIPEHQVSDSEAVLFKYTGCCLGLTGNVDCDPDDLVDIDDLTRLIDFMFISFEPLCCPAEADVNTDTLVDIDDLTGLIDYLFIDFTPLDPCP